jgi:hypothetical protein
VGVGVGERGQHHTTQPVGDRERRITDSAPGRPNRRDATVTDLDVDQFAAGLPWPQANVAQQQIGHASMLTGDRRTLLVCSTRSTRPTTATAVEL